MSVDSQQSTVENHQSPVDGHESTVDSARSSLDSRFSSLDFARRVIVERIRPAIDGGRFAIKRTVGESVEVCADIFADGHDVVVAVLRDRGSTTSRAERADDADKDSSRPWRETPMTLVAPGTDEWSGRFDVTALGWHEYAIVAWVDKFRSWRRDLEIKASAGQDVSLELL